MDKNLVATPPVLGQTGQINSLDQRCGQSGPIETVGGISPLPAPSAMKPKACIRALTRWLDRNPNAPDSLRAAASGVIFDLELVEGNKALDARRWAISTLTKSFETLERECALAGAR